MLLKGAETPRSIPVTGKFQATAYHEIVAGHARKLHPDLIVGVALRLLLDSHYAQGTMHSTFTVSKIQVQHRYTYTVDLTEATRELLEGFDLFDSRKINEASQEKVARQIAGLGRHGGELGISLGVQYRLLLGMLFSVSLTDMGFLRWKHVRRYLPVDLAFAFAGVRLNMDRLCTEFDHNLGAYVEH